MKGTAGMNACTKCVWETFEVLIFCLSTVNKMPVGKPEKANSDLQHPPQMELWAAILVLVTLRQILLVAPVLGLVGMAT